MELECTVVRAVHEGGLVYACGRWYADERLRAVVGMRVKVTFDADQPESVTAVSYTHLDVYKRQARRSWTCL